MIASGEVRPNRYVKVTSNVPGRIQRIYVEPGQKVSKGQALMLIESKSSERKEVGYYSPLQGLVADISTTVGETVDGGPMASTLMTIADMSKPSIEVNVDETEIAKVKVGQPAMIVVDAFGEAALYGVVSRKNPLPMAITGPHGGFLEGKEFKVTIKIRRMSDQIRDRLRPGMSATATITTR